MNAKCSRPKEDNNNMHKFLKVCLLAPLPPQFDGRNHSCGGIGHWTRMVSKFAEGRADVKLEIVDTTPKWRSIHNFPFWKRMLSGGFNLVEYLPRLFGLLVLGRVDIVHMTTSGGLGVIRDLLVMVVARFFGKPVVYHVRFGRVPELVVGDTLEWTLISAAMRMAAAVVVIDHETYRAVRQALPKIEVLLVPNCIDLRKIPVACHTVKKPSVFLFAGMVIPTKGVEELLAAWALVKRPDWVLHIVGPVNSEYRNELLENYPSSGVVFLGEKLHSEALSLISECDVFVFPSYTEGFPNAVLEAMATGRSIIASAVGAIPEMLSDGAGVLIPPKDVQSLSLAMQNLMNDSLLRNQLSVVAKEKVVNNYSIETVFDRYLEIWNDVLLKKKTLQ